MASSDATTVADSPGTEISSATERPHASHSCVGDERPGAADRLAQLAVAAQRAAHDLNNLLVAVLGNAELLNADLASAPDSQQLARDIQSAAREAALVVCKLSRACIEASGTADGSEEDPDFALRNILVIDPDPGVRAVAAALLARIGFAVEGAADDSEACALLRSRAHRFDAVVADAGRSNQESHRRLTALRAAAPDLPVVLCSSRGDELADLPAKRLAWARKPFRLAELSSKLATAAGGVRA
jgi:CheY-like chemotaxis protein